MFGAKIYYSRWLLIMIVMSLVMVGVGEVQAQIDVSLAVDELMKINKRVWDYVVDLIAALLFCVFVWQLCDAWINGQIRQKLIWLIGIGLFIIILKAFPSMFELLGKEALVGSKVMQ